MQERLRSGSQDLKDVLKANGGYPRALQVIEEGVWTIDADGVTDSINSQGAEILGYAPGPPPVERFRGEHCLVPACRPITRTSTLRHIVDVMRVAR